MLEARRLRGGWKVIVRLEGESLEVVWHARAALLGGKLRD